MARRGRPPKVKPEEAAQKEMYEPQVDMQKIRNYASTMLRECERGDKDEDMSGHKIAARYGYLKRIIEELYVEVNV